MPCFVTARCAATRRVRRPLCCLCCTLEHWWCSGQLCDRRRVPVRVDHAPVVPHARTRTHARRTHTRARATTYTARARTHTHARARAHTHAPTGTCGSSCCGCCPFSSRLASASTPSCVTAAISRCRCGEPSHGADVASPVPGRCGRGEPSPGADMKRVRPVPVQMWEGRAQSRCRGVRGEPIPGRDAPASQPHGLPYC